MRSPYSIVDWGHGDGRGEFPTLDAALAELYRLVRTPWDQPPNRPPCTLWEGCLRSWELIAPTILPDAERAWRLVVSLEISKSGPHWSLGPDAVPTEAEAIGPSVRRGRARRLRLRREHGDRQIKHRPEPPSRR